VFKHQYVVSRLQNEEPDSHPGCQDLARVLGVKRVKKAQSCTIWVKAIHTLKTWTHRLDAQGREFLTVSHDYGSECE